jgi:hypothetical protein
MFPVPIGSIIYTGKTWIKRNLIDYELWKTITSKYQIIKTINKGLGHEIFSKPKRRCHGRVCHRSSAHTFIVMWNG